jgi:hypothetical protein
MSILVVNVGTFCDRALMDAATLPLAQGNAARLIYLTDAKHHPVHAHTVAHFHTPSHITKDVHQRAANTSKSVLGWGVRHPVDAVSTLLWVQRLQRSIKTLIRKHKPRAVMAHYGALPALLRVSHDLLFDGRAAPALGVFVLYFAPGVPNATVPWVFDARLKKGTPAAHAKVARASWETALARMQPGGGGVGAALCTLRRMTHVLCWDAQMMPPLQPLYRGLDIVQVGSLHDATGARGPSPPSLKLPPGRRLALISFGSYAVRATRSMVGALLRGLLRHVDAVVLHDTSEGALGAEVKEEWASRVLVVTGWLPYTWIVPRVHLVVFTGSLCLQSTCLWHRVPMVFVPVLAEQYFWAHNYQARTGVPFVRPGAFGGVDAALRAALVSKRAAVDAYLEAVAASMRAHRGARALKKLVLTARV